jgi:hypothetical protein
LTRFPQQQNGSVAVFDQGKASSKLLVRVATGQIPNELRSRRIWRPAIMEIREARA